MRREWVLLIFAAVVVVAVAAATAAAASRPPADPASDSTAAPVAVQRVGIPATGMREEAAMVLVGTALIGLAAAVRRAA
jgi:LPXTG-motif cell wall-anchored protein